MNADQLEIKIAQGAKPGEGGQLPGKKVLTALAVPRLASRGAGHHLDDTSICSARQRSSGFLRIRGRNQHAALPSSATLMWTMPRAGVAVHRQPAAVEAGRAADQPAAAPRHLLHRGPGAAHLRPPHGRAAQPGELILPVSYVKISIGPPMDTTPALMRKHMTRGGVEHSDLSTQPDPRYVPSASRCP